MSIRAVLRSAGTPWVVLAGAVAVGLGWQPFRPVSPTPGPSATVPGGAGSSPARTVHYVTPRQLLAGNAMAGGAVADLAARSGEGSRLDWPTLSGGRPVVLVFVKQGCPCNVEFEPFFQRVERLYRDQVRFARVIDGDGVAARTYATESKVAHPVLADPDRTLIRRFRAENGGYVALLKDDATIAGYWPGCSADGLRELGRRIAQLSGVDERPLDTSGMPGPLITGCPFDS